MTAETFEQVLAAALADGSFTPAWKKFVATRFFVPVEEPANDNPAKLKLRLAPHGGAQALVISEVRERLDQHDGSLATLSGADVVRLLQAEADILVALPDRAFSIARDRVQWLKQGIEQSQARAAARAREAAAGQAPPPPPPAAAAAAPIPVPVPAPAPAPRKHGGVLDVAALKPRGVSLPAVGLEFFVPGHWRESRNLKSLRFNDPDGATAVEASGSHRHGVSLAQWQEMRLALVKHEMRYLKQDGESYPFDGDNWRDRVKGVVTEFTGTFPGDEGESRYLVACVRIDGAVASIAIRAPLEEFERNRALYKWLLGRVDMVAASPAAPRAGAGAASAPDYDEAQTPAVFGFSLAGRIGRLRSLAYCFPVFAPLFAAAILGPMLFQQGMVVGLTLVVAAFVLTVWGSLRLMALRLHDVNLTSRWILGFVALFVAAGIFRTAWMIGLLSVLFWLMSLVIFYLMPGTQGENDYGPPPAPDSALVKLGAALFIALQLAGIYGQVRMYRTGGFNGFAQAVALGQKPAAGGDTQAPPREPVRVPAGIAFSPPDNAFTVNLPRQPEEMLLPPQVIANMGAMKMRQYRLVAGERLYVVQALDFANLPADRDAVMDWMQRSVSAGGAVTMQKPVPLNGVNAREVRVELPDGMVRAARFGVKGAKCFVIIVNAADTARNAPYIDAFMESLQIN